MPVHDQTSSAIVSIPTSLTWDCIPALPVFLYYAETNYLGPRKVSFVEKLSLSQRVYYWRFYCIFLPSPLLLLRLTEEDIKPDSILSLTYVKFQNVQSLTVSIVTYNVSRNLHNSNLNGQMWYVVHIVIWFTKLLCWQAIHNSHPPSHQCHVTITLPSHDSSHSYSFKTTREGRRQQWWTT